MYIIFGGNTYYPSGGWSDYIGKAKTLNKARKKAAKLKDEQRLDWVEIVDLTTLEEVR